MCAGGIKNSVTAMVCRTVFSFPPFDAGTTLPLRSSNIRQIVMPISLTRITMVTHTGRLPLIFRQMSAVEIKALSAMGSAIFPKSVTRFFARAISPSSLSVIINATKQPNDHNIQDMCWPSLRSTNQAKRGIAKIRMLVRMLGTFRFDGLAGVGALETASFINNNTTTMDWESPHAEPHHRLASKS